MSGLFSLARAGRWLLHSGIQEPSGGVARYYRADIRKNKAISTEITGYFASTLVFLFNLTGNDDYLRSARSASRFLCDHAWDEPLQTFPFEHPSPSDASEHRAFFFDCGIIVRGLLAVWRVTREDRLLELAVAASHGMIADFHSGDDYHPILNLPGKQSLPRTAHWSRSPGCYQLKSALAWWEVAEVTGDSALRSAYFEMLEAALLSHSAFLPGASENAAVMDRLHPYCYFLEGLRPVLDRPECAAAHLAGIERVNHHLRQIAPEFVRSDVYAQLLRARFTGGEVDRRAAEEEAGALAQFQAVSDDPRIDGSFLFGRRDGKMISHANPVSTAFGIQALVLWSVEPAPPFPPI